jgi:FG-GAP-like repeat
MLDAGGAREEVAVGSVVVAVLVVSVLSPGAGRGQNFVFVEETTQRLPADTTLPGTSSTDVDLVDVDADGDVDLFVAEGTDSPAPRPNRLLLNDGDGIFNDVSATQLPPGVANSTKADFGDVDEDGDVDAIVANLGPEQLLINDGNGSFADASAQLPPPPQFPQDITADARFADIDHDGDLDVLLSNENPFDPSPTGGGQNRALINDGAGVFVDETASRLPAATDQTGAMLAGDIDEDGDLDIVVLNRGADLVLVNDGDGFFTDETATRFPPTTDSSRGGGLADLDGDDDLDLVVGNSRNEPIALYLNSGGVFLARNFRAAPLPDETDTGLELVDLDDDGDLDVYVPNAGAFTVGHGFGGGPDRYFRNNGNAKFTERTARHFPAVNDPTTDAAFGDIDGDEDLDLVVGNSGPNGEERVFVQYPRGHRT